MRRININKTGRNHVIDSGGNGDVIVLLHGFLSSANYWSKLQPILARVGYRVVAIDLLGFGNAPKPNESEYDYVDHIKYIEATLKKLNIVKPFVMVGHSMGALLAARYGKVHAGNIRSLILLHPPLYRDTLQTRLTLRSTGMIYRFLLDSPYRRLGWTAIKLFRPAVLGRHSHQSREKSLANIIEAAEMFRDLKAITPSTLLLVGRKDRKEYMENISKFSVSSSVSIVVENINHHSPRLQPVLVRDRIVEFIQ